MCDGNVAKVCDGQGGFASTTQCPAECKDGLGCVRCVPNAATCTSTPTSKIATICDATGTVESRFTCEGPGMACDTDGCHGECSPASLGMGYQGCDFLPTVTANSVWTDRAQGGGSGGFHFGVVIGNVSESAAAHIEITGPNSVVSFTLPPSETRTQLLDWVLDLKGSDWEVPYQPGNPAQSIKKTNGAYRVVSNRPIVVYQFNSLENEIPDTRGCPSVAGASANCFSYSSDGSLLLPVHALSSEYVVAGFHAWHKDSATLPPGSTSGRLNMGDFISIAAPQGNTEVSIKLRPGQNVLSGPDLPRFVAGETTTFTLAERQVAQLFTPGTVDSDTFSGTEITTKENKPVQVLSGVGCVNLFKEDTPCGHIEESVFPRETLGKDYVVPMLTQTGVGDAGTAIRQKIRIQSISDGTAISFEPRLLNNVTLSNGEPLEIATVTTDLRISSTTPFAVTQYVTGRTSSSRISDNVGSANQLMVPPISQFRTSYVFPVSPEFGTTHLAIMAPTGAAVSVDNQPVPADKFLAVGASGMSVARLTIGAGNRVHRVNADKPVGIVVFGIGPFASYALAGGLDLKRSGASTPR